MVKKTPGNHQEQKTKVIMAKPAEHSISQMSQDQLVPPHNLPRTSFLSPSPSSGLPAAVTGATEQSPGVQAHLSLSRRLQKPPEETTTSSPPMTRSGHKMRLHSTPHQLLGHKGENQVLYKKVKSLCYLASHSGKCAPIFSQLRCAWPSTGSSP